jgi:hypothetical protein
MSRHALPIALLLTLGCSHAPESDAPAAPAVVAPVPVAPALAAWPAPSFTRTADPRSSTDVLAITLSGESLDGIVDVRTARGPTPAACDAGVRVEAAHGEDGAHSARVSTLTSVTICIRDADGNVRASIASEGYRSIPWAHASYDAGHAMLHQTVEPLDDDVTALVYVAVPVPALDAPEAPSFPRLGCRTQAGAGPNDDPPEHCTYDCSSARVVGEIPRAVIDALVASPTFSAPHETEEELLTPHTLAVRIPVAASLDDELVACVRTGDGALTTNAYASTPLHDGPWYGCDFDTVSGCIADPGRDRPLAAGDTLLGRTDQGAVVRATIRRALVRRTRSLTLLLADGSAVEVAADAMVLTEHGDVRADALVEGDVLWRASGAMAFAAFEDETGFVEDHTRVDLVGATYFLVHGVAVHDAGGAESETATRHVAPSFFVGDGDGDCSIAIAWAAASTPHDVGLGAAMLDEGPWHGAHTPDCSAPLVTLEAGALAAVATLGADAQVVVTLSGEIQCETPYAVSRCDGARALGEALPVASTPACLPAGTLVDVPNGRIAIEKLESGDVVEAFDPHRGLVRAQVIAETVHRGRALLRIVLDDGTALESTPEHVFLVGAEHLPRTAGDLRAGDVLSVRDDGALLERRVASVAAAGEADVYELRVTAPDTYFANGVLVHNY